MYRVSIVYVSCMYRDYQRNYGCKGSKNNWYMQVITTISSKKEPLFCYQG